MIISRLFRYASKYSRSLGNSWVDPGSAFVPEGYRPMVRSTIDLKHQRSYIALHQISYPPSKIGSAVQMMTVKVNVAQSRPLHRSLTKNKKMISNESNELVSQFDASSHLPHSNDSIPLSEDEKLLLVKAEYQLYKEEGEHLMPSELKESLLQELVSIKSLSGRLKLLRFFSLKEIKQGNKQKRNEQNLVWRKENYIKEIEKMEETSHLVYGLWRNSYFMRFDTSSMNTVDNHRLITAALYGQHIIFDNSFDSYMTKPERINLVQQLMQCFGTNRSYKEPFNMHICNFDANSETGRLFTTNNQPKLWNIHKENYLDLFPKERLVYLTPHAREVIDEYDHDAIYIIGNIVDKGNMIPRTMAKAKFEGIQMKKFPLERYLDWGTGKKTFPLNHVLGILLELKETGSWKKAFDKNIPARNLKKLEHGKVDKFKNRVMKDKSSYKILKSIFDD